MTKMKHAWFPVTLSLVLTHSSDRFNEKHSCRLIYIYIKKIAADYNGLLLYNRWEKAKITMDVDVLVKDSEAVGVNILTKVYCSGEASDVL